MWFTPGWKSTGWTWRWAGLWNDLGFSLCAAPSICCVVATSDDGKKSEMGVSADWCVAIEHQRSSSIRELSLLIIRLANYSVTTSLIYKWCQVWFTLGWKSAEWTQRWADLWNDLGFSLCAAPSVCHVVATSDEGEEVRVGVSAEWCVAVEHRRSSSIRDYLRQLSD